MSEGNTRNFAIERSGKDVLKKTLGQESQPHGRGGSCRSGEQVISTGVKRQQVVHRSAGWPRAAKVSLPLKNVIPDGYDGLEALECRAHVAG